MFAGLADNPTNLAHMKRQLNNLQVIPFPCWCHSQYVQCEMRKSGCRVREKGSCWVGIIKSVKFDIKVD